MQNAKGINFSHIIKQHYNFSSKSPENVATHVGVRTVISLFSVKILEIHGMNELTVVPNNSCCIAINI